MTFINNGECVVKEKLNKITHNIYNPYIRSQIWLIGIYANEINADPKILNRKNVY